MGNHFRVKTLASAVGLALMGIAFQPATDAQAATSSYTAAQVEARQVYIITFAEQGLVRYEGGVSGLAATAPRATNSRRLDVHSPAAQAYADYLATARASHVDAIQGLIGRNLGVTHEYAVTRNGIAAEMTGLEAAAAARAPGVTSVRPAGVEYLDTYRGPKFIGADKIWDGSATPTGAAGATFGEGMVAAILDGGTASGHPSFANDPACGFSPSNPKLAIAVDCSSTSGSGVCNGPNPEANPGFGHGVHTSSTVAGNTIDNTVTPAPALPDGVTMSGVAPCAAIHHYKVCATNTCGGADILAGIDNAIRDGADTLNFSISGGTSPWFDNDRGFLDAVDAGIFVAASAGNTNATITNPVGQVNHRGPWVTTVAASTQDMIIGPNLTVVGPGTPPAEATNVAMNPGSNPQSNNTPTWTGKPIKTYSANIEGCTASGGIAAGTFTGSVAVLRRGTCAFTEKVANAAAAGAELVVIANNTFGSINMNTDGATLPAYSIRKDAGDAIIPFLAGNGDAGTADVKPIGVGTTLGDVIADFSFRGPTPAPLADLTKPDVTAPGVDIYAATDPASGNYEFMSGTSMSGPHVAGAGLLVAAVQPDFTVPEIKSALMTTAKKNGFMEDESTPWNVDVVGSGRIDLTKATLVGFTLDETTARFLAANPSGGSINVKDLNLAAVRNLNCTPECTFTRTIKNVLGTSATWSTSFTPVDEAISVTVSPATFSIAPGATQEITITAKPPAGTAMSDIGFGYLDFTEANGQSPVQHFTVAIKGEGEAGIDLIFKNGFDEGGVSASFYDGFDDYAAGSNVAGQGGWKGWGNDDAAGATVVDEPAGRSMPNSIDIAGDSDLIHEFDYTSGSWTITVNQYIPSTFSGKSYFLFENVYDDVDMSIISWSTQVYFDSATGQLANEAGAANPFTANYITDQWVQLKLVVDLDADLQTFYYNGVEMYSGSWSNQFPAQTVPGIPAIGSIDLYANGATSVFYDDVKIVPTTP